MATKEEYLNRRVFLIVFNFAILSRNIFGPLIVVSAGGGPIRADGMMPQASICLLALELHQQTKQHFFASYPYTLGNFYFGSMQFAA